MTGRCMPTGSTSGLPISRPEGIDRGRSLNGQLRAAGAAANIFRLTGALAIRAAYFDNSAATSSNMP